MAGGDELWPQAVVELLGLSTIVICANTIWAHEMHSDHADHKQYLLTFVCGFMAPSMQAPKYELATN